MYSMRSAPMTTTDKSFAGTAQLSFAGTAQLKQSGAERKRTVP